MKNKLLNFIQQWDGIIAIPLAFGSFVLIQLFGSWLFGQGIGFYDPSIYQAAVMSAGVVVIFNTVAWLGLYMNFRQLFRYYKTDSKTDFKNLSSCEKLYFLGFVYFAYLTASIVLFLKLV